MCTTNLDDACVLAIAGPQTVGFLAHELVKVLQGTLIEDKERITVRAVASGTFGFSERADTWDAEPLIANRAVKSNVVFVLHALSTVRVQNQPPLAFSFNILWWWLSIPCLIRWWHAALKLIPYFLPNAESDMVPKSDLKPSDSYRSRFGL